MLTAATTRPVVLALEADGGLDDGSLAHALDDVDCWYADAHGAADWRAAMTRRLAAEAVAEVLA